MNEPGIDLTGKLIIKTALGDDIRRILITNEDITYDELVLMMQRVYRGKLNSTDDIVIKYKDEDNDLITIFDSSDLSFAIQCSRILKITLFVNGKPEPLQSDDVKLIKTELRHIRDRCTQLLDKLDDRPPENGPIHFPSADTTAKTPRAVSNPAIGSPRRMTPQQPLAEPSKSGAAGGKEFDPLSSQRSIDDSQNKVMSSFGIAASNGTERSGTPDSISSIGSASNRPQQPTQPDSQSQGMYGQAGSGQKLPPWQQQQQVSPSPYSAGTQGRQHHQRALMQTHMYRGHEQDNSATTQPPNPPVSAQPASFQPVSSAQQPGVSYPGQQPQQPAQGQMQPAQGQMPPGQGQMPAQGQIAQPQPAYPPQQGGVQTSQPGYGQPGTSQYAGYPQPGAPGQPAAGSPRFGSPAPPQQAGVYSPTSQVSGQPQAVAPGAPVPAAYSYAQQPNQPAPPAQAPQPGGNPYARQGPGYGTGYPRLSGYPQGYQ